MKSIAFMAGLLVRKAGVLLKLGTQTALVLGALLALTRSNPRLAGLLKRTPIVSPLKKMGFSLA